MNDEYIRYALYMAGVLAFVMLLNALSAPKVVVVTEGKSRE